MAEFVMPRTDFMYRQFVDQNVKKLIDEQLLWERYVTKQRVNAMNVRYFKEQYVDIETPNDAALSRPIDPYLKSPNYRSPGADFPHTQFGEPREYNLGLYQLALEIDVPDEAQKFVEMENLILRSQTKLGNSFASKVNDILGNALTENWTNSTPTAIQAVSLSAGYKWNETNSTVAPFKDVIDAQEKIMSVAGYSYTPTELLTSKASYFDLRIWMAKNNMAAYRAEINLGPETRVTQIEGMNLIATDMVKQDFAVVADLKAAGILFEAAPLETHQYWTDADHVTHIQAMRTFNYALTDPKAVCLIQDTIA